MKTKLLLPLLSITLGTLPLLAELKYFPKDKEELIALVADESIKLDEIDVSKIKDMSYLFCRSDWDECKNSAKKRKNFKGIEKWDTSNVENMAGMFYDNKKFNEPIVNWDVGRVKDMSYMFDEARSFNQPLKKRDVSNVKNMKAVFNRTDAFNQPLDKWNVRNVENMEEMFKGAKAFNQPLGSWKLNPKANIKGMFAENKAFKQDLSSWGDINPFRKFKPKNRKELLEILRDESVPLKNIDVSQVTDMSFLFCRAMDTSTTMADFFPECQDSVGRVDFSGIETWDVSNVKTMEGMF
ncbi:BspA family leucine-rich repeat surface protein [Helicobacter anseris]|nr:BspA family leucine-rich repeat surface protein [Helicobacter anseris]